LVKADNLNFSKAGVKAVVREIFLPWYNAYRFLIQNISKWEAKENKSFEFVENIEEFSENFNVTDKWIQSALQILIRNVRKEMSEYKLYNVVPQLITFLENLTNWYVRLNRLRLKGDVDEVSMKVSLNVLFDVLLKVNVLMAPYVPFLTESMYQNMKLVINNESKFYRESIHHVMISDVNDRLMNEVITEKMKDVMSII
jgi:isoleucyl-tRNA synthetase